MTKQCPKCGILYNDDLQKDDCPHRYYPVKRVTAEALRNKKYKPQTPIEELSTDLALLFLAEWIAIEHGETKLQADNMQSKLRS